MNRTITRLYWPRMYGRTNWRYVTTTAPKVWFINDPIKPNLTTSKDYIYYLTDSQKIKTNFED